MQGLQNFKFISQGSLYSAAVAMSQTLDDLIGPETDEEGGNSDVSDFRPSQKTPTSNRRRRQPIARLKYSTLGLQTPTETELLPVDSSAGSFAFEDSPSKKQKLTPSAQLRSRNARTANDIDILEGLPIRQWKQVETQIGPPPVLHTLAGQAYFPELPMPRDFHMLPEHSQQLLRLARAPTARKPPTPANEDEEDNAGDDDRSKDANRGIFLSKWSQVPRHLEEPEHEYLAKRRPGLPSQPAGFGVPTLDLSQAGPTRKTKLKR
jgi:hypothetical protein